MKDHLVIFGLRGWVIPFACLDLTWLDVESGDKHRAMDVDADDLFGGRPATDEPLKGFRRRWSAHPETADGT